MVELRLLLTSGSYKNNFAFFLLACWGDAVSAGWLVARSVPFWRFLLRHIGENREFSPRFPENYFPVWLKVTSAGEEDLSDYSWPPSLKIFSFFFSKGDRNEWFRRTAHHWISKYPQEHQYRTALHHTALRKHIYLQSLHLFLFM